LLVLAFGNRGRAGEVNQRSLIDYYGERLIGCIECNRWGRRGDKPLVMELKADHLEALRDWRRRRDLNKGTQKFAMPQTGSATMDRR
jgi:hypothetical protein